MFRVPLCDVTEVCCLVSDVIATTAPISSEKPARQNSTNLSSEIECGIRRRITSISSVDGKLIGFHGLCTVHDTCIVYAHLLALADSSSWLINNIEPSCRGID